MKPSKVRKVKAWAVVWPGWEKYVTPAHHGSEAVAIFSTHRRAKGFARSYTNSSVMKIVPCEISYSLPINK